MWANSLEFSRNRPKLSADNMYRACELKDQTYEKTRTLHFSDNKPLATHHVMDVPCKLTTHESSTDPIDSSRVGVEHLYRICIVGREDCNGTWLQASRRHGTGKDLCHRRLESTRPLRGPGAILFISRDTCSDSIAKLLRAC